MTNEAQPKAASLLIDVSDLVDELERVEHALERWKALDAKALKDGSLSHNDETERQTVSSTYTLGGQAVLHRLIMRMRQAPGSSVEP